MGKPKDDTECKPRATYVYPADAKVDGNVHISVTGRLCSYGKPSRKYETPPDRYTRPKNPWYWGR